jgi:hypothetical protein
MTDRPILFSAPMVRALLEGKKTMTRRVLRPQPQVSLAGMVRFDDAGWFAPHIITAAMEVAGVKMPYTVGDKLWCRESLKLDESDLLVFAADDAFVPRDCIPDGFTVNRRSVPGIFMPRWASRLTLVVTDVRVQRLQKITEKDALAEGVQQFDDASDPIHEAAMAAGLRYGIWATDSGMLGGQTAVEVFARVWNLLNARRGFSSANNPWVAAISFRVEKRNIDDES